MRVSYEPSVETICKQCLAGAWSLLSGEQSRRPVSWVATVRSTGLGALSGGEIVLVPPHHVAGVIQQVRALGTAGVALVVLIGAPDFVRDIVRDAELPSAFVDADTDISDLRASIEAAILRWRKVLFGLAQQYHHALVEAAIAGADVLDLLKLADEVSGCPAYFTQGDGVTASRDSLSSAPPRIPLTHVHLKTQAQAARIRDREHELVVSPVLTGREKRGVVSVALLPGHNADAAEVLLSALASAIAIALAKNPLEGVSELRAVLARLDVEENAPIWFALSLSCKANLTAAASRVVKQVMGGRCRRIETGAHKAGIAVLVVSPDLPAWQEVVRFVVERLDVEEMHGGFSSGRAGSYPSAAAREALTAHSYASADRPLVGYSDIAVQDLLSRVPGGEVYARGLLGPLISEEDREDDLLLTLHVYLRLGRQTSRAANILQIHRNTLNYRLRKIERKLGRSVTEGEDLFPLLLALNLLPFANDNR